jgi:hypothetical protein
MATATREQVLDRVAGFGPLQNVFLLAEDNDTLGLPHPGELTVAPSLGD